jgi:hypothetical protein
MFAPDDEPVRALERERRLQAYRDRILDTGHFDLSGSRAETDPWGAGNIDDIAWVAQLMLAGHVPAQALLDRALKPHRLKELYKADAKRFVEATAIVPHFAGWLAMSELVGETPDLAVLRRWLDLGGPACGAISRAVLALEESGVERSAIDMKRIARALHDSALAVHNRSHARGEGAGITARLLTEMAEDRMRQEAPGAKAAGLDLLRRAAAIAPGGARRWVWLYDLAERSPAMKRWLENYPMPSQRSPIALLRAALDYETGAADGKPDLDAAICLYEMGTNVEPWAAAEGGELCTEFCLAVGRQLVWLARPEERLPRDAALGWFDRVVARGNPEALAHWMREAADQFSVAVRPPEEVLAQVERYLAAEPPGTSRQPLERAVRTIERQSNNLLKTGKAENAALAQRWLRVSALLEKAK